MSSKKKATVAAKKSATKAPRVEITPNSIVVRIGDRKKGGAKTKLLELIPKNGVTVSKLTVAAKNAELPIAKVTQWVKFLRMCKYVDVRA